MDLLRIAARVAGEMMEPVYMVIEYPAEVSEDDALARARKLIPCKTGNWEDVDSQPGMLVGNLECEPGYYDANPDGAEYGPDDAGVRVVWETP